MKPVYFIAEIGKACNGNLQYCKQLLSECSKAGVNAVRFPHFSLTESVYHQVLKKTTERAWSFKLHLPFLEEKLFSKDDYEQILEWCKELNLDFIATPWDIDSLNFFLNLGVEKYKINSINCMNIPLLNGALRNGKRVWLSTGGMSEAEIKDLCERYKFSHCEFTLMHAVLAYPAPANIINIRAMELLRKYHPKVGYSANDLTSGAVLIACAMGARSIDRHVHLPKGEAVTHKASLPINTFAEEIAIAREMEILMAREIKQESRGEMVNQDLLSKSLVLKKDLAKGKILSEENLTLQLPPRGVHAKEWFKVIGKEVVTDVRKGEYLYTENIKRFQEKKELPDIGNYLPGKRGVVVRLKDIDEMIEEKDLDYVEVHYAASDIDCEDICKDYDLDLVVHLPEYAQGILLDLSSHDENLRKFSIKIIDKVMQKARNLQPHFKRSIGPLKFIVHPGTLTYQKADENPSDQYTLFLDSLHQMDASGLEILIENMTPFAWFLKEDWSPMQGMSNSFLDAEDIARFCQQYGFSMCLDVCHAKLYCNHANKTLYSYMKTVKPYVKHLHFSDCTGIDGEGLQVGEGEINWQEICEVFSEYEYGWTPEIWNGHLDHGIKFFEAHDLLNKEFKRYFEKEASKEALRGKFDKLRERRARL